MILPSFRKGKIKVSGCEYELVSWEKWTVFHLFKDLFIFLKFRYSSFTYSIPITFSYYLFMFLLSRLDFGKIFSYQHLNLA